MTVHPLTWAEPNYEQRSRFRTVLICREGRFSLGRDEMTGNYVLDLPVSNSMVDYLEYYGITDEEFARFRDDIQAAYAFVQRCKAHQEDDRLVMKPGASRGTPS